MLGTTLGSKLLERMSDVDFKRAMKWLVTAIGAVMLLVFVPVLLPSVNALGIDLVHFGLVSMLVQWTALLTLGGLYLARSGLRRRSAGALAWIALGLLLARLTEIGELDNTLIAVSGDHVELTRLGGELTAVLTELNTAEEQWLELTEEAERASN